MIVRVTVRVLAVLVRRRTIPKRVIACCARMDMIAMVNMIFGRSQRLPVLTHMFRPRSTWHYECAHEQSKDDKTHHV